MLRSWLVLLLLANYLVVVGAGLVNRPDQPRYTAAHPYTHSASCQQEHYLRVDCFDRCNGDQDVVKQRTPGENAAHLLSIIKGIDVHCLSEVVVVAPPYSTVKQAVPAAAVPAVPAGVRAALYSPPRRG